MLFLMATDEEAYLNNKNLQKYTEFKTCQNHMIKKGNQLKAENLLLNNIECKFIWDNIENNNKKFIKTKQYAWLQPINI